MDHRVRTHQLVVHSPVVFSYQELGRPGLLRKAYSSGGARARRSGTNDGVVGIHETDERRELVIQPGVGAEPQYRDATRSEFVSGGIRLARQPQELHYGPLRAGT